jgi:4'-phosphopantetheinyl transferase
MSSLGIPPFVSPGDIHLWWARVASGRPDDHYAAALLSDDELARARRFLRAEDARRYIAARATLRRLLGAYLDVDPRGLRFEYGRHGKPRLSGDAGEALSFSVAHSVGAALFAFVRGRRIGVDLELIRDSAPLDVARQFFAADELCALFSLPAAGRGAAFYRCWTRKEAYLKATGLGLSAPLGAFAVSLAPREPRALSWNSIDPEDVGRWLFVEPAVGDGFAASVAVERTEGVGDIRCVVIDWESQAGSRSSVGRSAGRGSAVTRPPRTWR